MKKIFLFIAICFTFVLTGCSSNNLEKISVEELNEKLKNKETFIVYFTDKDSNLEKTLNKVLEENDLKGYKVDIEKISNEEKLALQTSIDYQNPSIVFVIKGIDPSILSHIKDEETTAKDITARLKDMNFIKEQS